MRRSLLLVPAALALIFSACGNTLPSLPGQLSAGAKGGESLAARSDMSVAAFVHYELAQGVAIDAKTAKAYKLQDASEDSAAKLAKALGVKGALRAEADGWSVGQAGKEVVTEAGGGMFVSRRGGSFGMYWSYPFTGSGCSTAPAEPNGASAAPDQSAPPDKPAGEPTCGTEPLQTTTTVPVGSGVTKSGAQRIATEALKAGGVDLTDPKITVESLDAMGFNVRFQPTVDGHVLDGYEASVVVDSDRTITGANGYLGTPKLVGTYDLATLRRAVERLNDTGGQPIAVDGGPRRLDSAINSSSANTSTGVPAGVVSSPPVTEIAPVGGPAVDVAPGDQPPEPTPTPTTITLTKAEVGLMLQGDSAGALWLVPAYNFSSDNGDQVVAAAADDKYIEQPTKTTGSDGGGSSGTGRSGGGTPTDPGGPSGNNCVSNAESTSSKQAGYSPIEATVCGPSIAVPAGTAVRFDITMSDADRGFVEGPCGDGVKADYGSVDDGNGEVQCLACATDVGPAPGKAARVKTHTFNKPGNYKATFTIASGLPCGPADPHDSTATIIVPITVK